MIVGWFGAIIELFLYFSLSSYFREKYNYQDMNALTYYWLSFTVLTGIWETTYLLRRNDVIKISTDFIKNKEHAWTNRYPVSMVIPKHFSKLFYAEYGAWADREYMTDNNYWSAFVEGSHCLFCAGFSLVALLYHYHGDQNKFYIAIATAMGNQFMNSVLYLAEYTIQMKNPNSSNYVSDKFPAGFMLLKRPFMWINILWIVMPAYIIYEYLNDNYLSVGIGMFSKIF